MGTIFLCVVVACFFGAGSYLALVKFHYEPYFYRNGIGSPEHRLLPAVFAALIAPCGILIFAWTSRDWINWVAPTIGIVLYMSCVFVVGELTSRKNAQVLKVSLDYYVYFHLSSNFLSSLRCEFVCCKL